MVLPKFYTEFIYSIFYNSQCENIKEIVFFEDAFYKCIEKNKTRFQCFVPVSVIVENIIPITIKKVAIILVPITSGIPSYSTINYKKDAPTYHQPLFKTKRWR